MATRILGKVEFSVLLRYRAYECIWRTCKKSRVVMRSKNERTDWSFTFDTKKKAQIEVKDEGYVPPRLNPVT